MKHKFSFLLLYGMTVLLGGLGALLLLCGEKAPRPSMAENRMLAGFPALTAQSLLSGEFMSGLEAYLSDGMPQREALITAAQGMTQVFALGEKSEEQAQQDIYDQVANLPEAPEEPTAAPSPSPSPFAQATQAPTQVPAATPVPEAKDLSDIPDCYFTCYGENGKRLDVYTFPAKNVRRMIRLLDAFRAVLPEDGHVLAAQPIFPGVADYLRQGEYTSWDSDLENLINSHVDPGVYMVSVQEVLQEPLLAGEYLYFRTDHHWTPRAACYTANRLLRHLGIVPRDYDDYSFRIISDFYGSAAKKGSGKMPDTLEVMIPDTPVQGTLINWDRTERETPLIYESLRTYMVFLGGNQGPWQRFETGVDCGRSCLVFGDSFSKDLIPFLTPYYETVHVSDVRQMYFHGEKRTWSISDYIRENGVDDVYILYSTANGVNTDTIMEDLLAFL